MALQALIFDMDGTLIDTEELHRQAFNAAFIELGLFWIDTATRRGRLSASMLERIDSMAASTTAVVRRADCTDTGVALPSATAAMKGVSMTAVGVLE